MIFLIITQVSHIKNGNQYFSYAPYVREMNIWAKYVSELIIVAPLTEDKISPIDLAYEHQNITFLSIDSFNILSAKDIFKTLFKIPKIALTIFQAMQMSDHIHLRCPGNVGLLGSIVQIFFPLKPKTAKYAGNWDFNSKQPFSYKMQQKILSNTFFTRNMQVLVYGEWTCSSKNIRPFFTATYLQSEIEPITIKNFDHGINFMFVGTLVAGKNPLYAIQLVQKLKSNGFNVSLNLYGDGVLRPALEKYIIKNNLSDFITLQGNQNKETVKQAYQNSQFMLLPSESEGWPKAVAEAMFWGCVPIATKVSCVPYMVDHENRGLLLNMQLESDLLKLNDLLNNLATYQQKSSLALQWSRKYTLDFFESEIKKLLQS
jgi:glycosyltransferase involved in cell wall biosynthesis